MALASLVPFQGPKKSQFSGPTPSNAPHNDVAPLKTITYRAIKTTDTLIVIFTQGRGRGGRVESWEEVRGEQFTKLGQETNMTSCIG
jgi:hypothetical protein